jgi:hypothetical protein
MVEEAVNARDRAVAADEETKSALGETKAILDDTKSALDAARARVARLEADLETVRAERDADIARLEGALEQLRADRDSLVAAQEAASAGRADALDSLAARAEGAVVVLPGVALPEPEVGPVAPRARVSWRPTWSEWANHDDDADDAGGPSPAPVPDVVDVADDAASDVLLDGDVDEDAVRRRYLNVAATIGQLLPEDLGPLLLSGATIIRREGRLFATVAVTSNRWAPPGSEDEKQAKKLADAGYRVEWTTDAPLAC